MLESDFAENLQSVIEIDDFSQMTIHAMIDFLQTGLLWPSCFVNHRSAIELLACAEKYDIESLKRSVQVGLQNLVTLETVTDIVIHAVRQNARELTDVCVGFIAKNFQEVSESPEFERLSANCPTILQTILREVTKCCQRSKKSAKRRRLE